MLFLHQVIKNAFMTIARTKEHRDWRIQLAFVSLKLLLKFKFMTTKYRGMKNKHISVLRNAFMFTAIAADPSRPVFIKERVRNTPSLSAATPVPTVGQSQKP